MPAWPSPTRPRALYSARFVHSREATNRQNRATASPARRRSTSQSFQLNMWLHMSQLTEQEKLEKSEVHEKLSEALGEEVPRQRRRPYLSVLVKTEKHTLALTLKAELKSIT
ncbi:unnamed protein product [Pleuronectes platessa]|uniref:Uncharacterized protein n=1 Tax=Pleuronectes platessa TaxID=8262 RepID=A0A9N7TGN7_PLEPL|nr:unnamed protein product [Pleuronectes platessa]